MSQKLKIEEHTKATNPTDKTNGRDRTSMVSKANTKVKNGTPDNTTSANITPSTEDNITTENGSFEHRMEVFVTTYVKEFEARLFFYDLIHRGQIDEAKKLSPSYTEKVMADIGKYGSFPSGFIASIALASTPLSLAAAATAGATGFRSISAGETVGKWIAQKVNSKQNDKKRKDYANKLWHLIKLLNEDRIRLRKILTSAALDTFRCFEQQFVKVNNNKKWRRGMMELAKEGVHRSINYSVKKYKPTNIKCDEDEEIISISTGVIKGKSKKRSRPDLVYEHDNVTIKWTSLNIYEKTGIAVENGEKYTYYEKNDQSNDTNKYGYRLLLNSEDWAKIKEKYRSSSEKNRFQNYKYKFKTLENDEKKQISNKIDCDNDILTKGSLKEVVDEVKQSITDEINESLKSLGTEAKENFRVLQKIASNIKKMDVQELEKKFLEHLDEIKRTVQDISVKQEEHRTENRALLQDIIQREEQHRDENKSLHEDTHGTLQEILQKEEDQHTLLQETREMVQSMCDGKPLENNQPILFDINPPINTFTRQSELNLLNEIIQKTPKQNLTKSVIWGLGGIGKTQLARQYIENIGSNIYENIIWINSETETDIIDSFIRLAKKFKLKIPDDVKDKIKIKIILNEVYEILSKRDTLFIFDNAEKSQSFMEMLPKNIYSFDKKIHILITSRNREWGRNISDIHLQELSLEDGMQLVKQGLDIIDDSENENIIRLLDKLQNFPLCLNQAVSYIRERKLSGIFTIRKYLNEFENIPKDLFDSNSFKEFDNDPYAKTAYTTWLITINKIRGENLIGDLAIKIFDIMSYLAPQNIKRRIFRIISENSMDLEKATRLLAKYSMIDIVQTNNEAEELEEDVPGEEGERDETCFQVHRTVQHVTRLHLKESNTEESVIENTFKVLSKYLVITEETLISDNKVREGLPHFETFLTHIKVHYGPDHYQVAITLRNLGNAYGSLGDVQKQKELLEKALNIFEKHYGPDHYQVAITLTNFGNAYGDLGDVQKEKEVLEKALNIFEKHYGPDHYLVAITLTNLGNAYGFLGDVLKKKKNLEKALVIFENHYGCNHFIVSYALEGIGEAFGELGDCEEKLNFLKQALQLRSEHFGSDHYEVASPLENLGVAYGELGNSDKKLELLQQALSINEKHYGPSHFKLGFVLENLGIVYLDLGETEKGIELLMQALSVKEKHFGCNHFELVFALENLGIALGELGFTDEKIAFLERTLSIKQEHYGPHHYQLGPTFYNLAVAYDTLGDYVKKNEFLGKAFNYF